MPIQKYLRNWAVAGLAAFALMACSENAEDAAVVPASGAAVSGGEETAPPIPVMGEEVRILAFGDSLFAGYGFEEPETDS